VRRAALVILLAAAFLQSTPLAGQDLAAKHVGVVLSDSTRDPYLAALRDGLRDRGWVQGQNLILDARYYQGQLERIPEIAAELSSLRAEVIVIGGVPPTLALKQAEKRIPIVVASATDPAATGLVTPGSNVAAFNVLPPESAPKQLDMLREAVPGLRRLALLWNGSNPASQLNSQRVREAAQAVGISVVPLQVPGPAQIEALLMNLRRQNVHAIFLVADPQFFSQRKRIGELTTATGLPTMCQESDYADAGSLIAYGASVLEMFRQSASYVDRILKGARPADLPIGPPTPFELVVNRRTAKAMNYAIPPAMLARANRVIN